MGQNLTGQTISSTYEDLVQISGSILTNGLGTDITSIAVTASNAVSSSYAVTASFALNAPTVNTGSLMVTGSATNNVLTFTKGDGSTFNLTVDTGSAVTVDTGSLMVTGSVSSNTLTFTKGDGSQFSLTVNTGSAVTVNTGSLLVTASISDATTTYTKGDGSTFALTVNNVQNAISASFATTASYAVSSSANSLTLQQVTTNGATTTNAITIGNEQAKALQVKGGLEISSSDYPTLEIQSIGGTYDPGVVLQYGSTYVGIVSANPSTLDIQHLAGGKVAISASTDITGSLTVTGGITGSLFGTASFTTTASYALQALSASYAPASSPFPFTGSAIISGSLEVTGSSTVLSFSNADSYGLRFAGTTTSGPNIIIGGNYSGSNNPLSGSTGTGLVLLGGGLSTNPNRFINMAVNNAIIAGGTGNQIIGKGTNAGIFAGINNQIASGSETPVATQVGVVILGGNTNKVFHGQHNAILAGQSNTIISSSADGTPSNNAIVAGQTNIISGSDWATIIGGSNNTMNGAPRSTILAGSGSLVTVGFGGALVARTATVAHTGSVVIGGNGITTTQEDTVYVPNFNASGSAVVTGSLVVTGSTTLNSNSGTALQVNGRAGTTTLLRLSQLNDNADNFVVTATDATNATLTMGNDVGFGSLVFNGSGNNNITSAVNLAITAPTCSISGLARIANSLIVTGSLSLSGSIVTGNPSTSTALGTYTAVIGGNNNDIAATANNSAIVGGENNVINSGETNAVILGGQSNTMTSVRGAIISSLSSSILGDSAGVVIGGQANSTNGGYYQGIVAGQNNSAVGTYSFIGGGFTNTVSNEGGAIIGGTSNTVSHNNSVILGGSSITTRAANTAHAANIIVTTSTLLSGSLTVSGSTTFTGSVVGNVNALSISSNTASLDLSRGNFYTLQLVSGSNTFINPSNIKAGQTINLLVNTTGSATVSFPSSVKQVSGSAYVPTTTTGVDVVTFISFDASSLYLSNVKNLV